MFICDAKQIFNGPTDPRIDNRKTWKFQLTNYATIAWTGEKMHANKIMFWQMLAHLDFLQPNPCSTCFRSGDPKGHVEGIAMVSKDGQQKAIHRTMERFKIFQRGFVVLR